LVPTTRGCRESAIESPGYRSALPAAKYATETFRESCIACRPLSIRPGTPSCTSSPLPGSTSC
jgi:hypothetical protein